MSSLIPRRGLLATAAASALLAACAGEAAAPGARTSLSPQQALQVGTQLSRELGSSIASLALGSGGGLALVASSAFAASSAFTRVASATAAAPCPAPDNMNDADHDGIPDNATFTFALPQCRTIVNGDTTDLTGSVRVSDPVFSPPPDLQAFGYRASIANLVVRLGSATADSSYTETRNGELALVAGTAGMAQEHAFDIVRVDHGGTSHLVTQWHATFVPATGTALVIGAPLPHGFFSAQGTTAWQRAEFARQFARQFAIATAQPLEFDPSCAATAPNRFRSGEVRAVVAGSGGQAFVRIVFANCAEPAITVQSGG